MANWRGVRPINLRHTQIRIWFCSRRLATISKCLPFGPSSHVISHSADPYQRRRRLSNVSEGWKIITSPFLPSFTGSVGKWSYCKGRGSNQPSSGTKGVVRLTGHDKFSNLSNGSKTLMTFLHCTAWVWLVHGGPYNSWLTIVAT